MSTIIFFDSGYTLNYPKTGNWFITPQTKEILGIDLMSIDKDTITKTIHKIINVLEYEKVNTLSQEIALFTIFYEKLLSSLGYSYALHQNIYKELSYDLVTNTNKYAFYDEVPQLITQLSSNYNLGIISNAWPSLRRIYSYNNLDKYFSVFLISSELGILKPDLTIFRKAIKAVPSFSKIIYIDDKIENIISANKVGMQGQLLNRNKDSITKLLSKLNIL